ncbi:MAG: hypothetical protein SFX72_07495 [Isosphaeraceae bacterium]|nr:hypothetical protein [Isosphaeraceae bacterium]
MSMTQTNFKKVAHPMSGRSLDEKTKQSLEKVLTSLVRNVDCSDLGIGWSTDIKQYTAKFLEYLGRNSYLTSGEKFSDGARIFFTEKNFVPEDWNWVVDTVGKIIFAQRMKDKTFVSTRLYNSASSGWLDWSSSECVFSAITLMLGLRFKWDSPPSDQEAKEKAFHMTLANKLQVSEGLVADEVMCHLMQTRLGWKRMKKVSIVRHQETTTLFLPNTFYVISVCENKHTDFWHTMLGHFKTDKTWTIVDRQFERRDTKERKTPLVTDKNNEINMWRVELKSPLLLELRRELAISTKKTELADYLDPDWEV